HNAGMIAQAPHLVNRLLAHVVEKRRIAGIHAAAEHEVLPDHDPEFVADIEELVGFVIAAPPGADHVHVGFARGAETPAILLSGDSRGKTIKRNRVSALAEYRDSIHHKFKALAPLIKLAMQFERAQPGAHAGFVGVSSLHFNARMEAIEILRAV